MSGNTRELATSLVEMKIALGDLPISEAATSQRGNSQQLPEDAADVLSEDPVTVDSMDDEDPVTMDSMDDEDSHKDPMNLNDLPAGPNEDVVVEVENAKD